MQTRILAIVGVLLAVPALASAQRWGRERFPQSGACFFQDRDFRGDYFCVPAGANVVAVPDEMNDQISSIRVFGRAEVMVFRDVRFGGDSARFGGDVRNLRREGWNDRISSLRISGQERPPDRFGNLNDEQRGRDRDRRVGEEADRIIRRAYQDILGRDPDEGGLRQYRSRIIDDHWNEEQVRNSLRTSPEFAGVRRARAEDIVRRAYRSVLNRDPDNGAEGYIQNVLRDNWSQQDVERALRNSAEFRQRR
jgi:hypothetical protein